MARRKPLPILSKAPPPEISPPPKARLLKLPNEALDTIALHFEATHDLCSLALTCGQLRRSAQEALFKPLRPSQSRFVQLFETLLDRPDLGSRAHTVDLRDLSLLEVGPLTLWPGGSHYHTKCRDLVTNAHGRPMWDKLLTVWNLREEGAYTAACMFLLSVLLRNPRELILRMSEFSSHNFLFHPRYAFRLDGPDPYGKLSLIKKLVLKDRPNFRNRDDRTVCLLEFRRLQHLKLPMQLLRMPMYQHVPSSIEHIKFQVCPSSALCRVEEFATRKEAFPELRKVDLLYKGFVGNFLVSIMLGYSHDLVRLEDAVRIITSASVELRLVAYPRSAHTSPQTKVAYGSSNFLQDLRACSHLSSLEIGVAIARGLRFSEVVARDTNGEPRKRSRLERKMVSMYMRMPILLFTSPTFAPKAWSTVRMFNGQTRPEVVASAPEPAKKIFKSGGDREEQPHNPTHEIIDKSCFARKQELVPTETSGTFNPAKWSDTNFFPASERDPTQEGPHSGPSCNHTYMRRAPEKEETQSGRSLGNLPLRRSTREPNEARRIQGHGALTPEELIEFDELLFKLGRET